MFCLCWQLIFKGWWAATVKAAAGEHAGLQRINSIAIVAKVLFNSKLVVSALAPCPLRRAGKLCVMPLRQIMLCALSLYNESGSKRHWGLEVPVWREKSTVAECFPGAPLICNWGPWQCAATGVNI